MLLTLMSRRPSINTFITRALLSGDIHFHGILLILRFTVSYLIGCVVVTTCKMYFFFSFVDVFLQFPNHDKRQKAVINPPNASPYLHVAPRAGHLNGAAS